jgi:hypothetical protein
MWRPFIGIAVILLMAVCVFGVAASDTESARFMAVAALVPWLVFIVARGIRGRRERLWLALAPVVLTASLLLLLDQFDRTTRRVYPIRGLVVGGTVMPDAYGVRLDCQLRRGTCEATHELTFDAVAVEVGRRRLEPGRRGLLVREGVVPRVTNMRRAQLPPGLAGEIRPASGASPADAIELLAIGARQMCAQIEGFPRNSFLDAPGALEPPRVEREPPESVGVRWCTDAGSAEVRFAFIVPRGRIFAPLIRPFVRVTVVQAVVLAMLLSLATVIARRYWWAVLLSLATRVWPKGRPFAPPGAPA